MNSSTLQSVAGLVNASNSEFMMTNSSVDEVTEFLSNQIKSPFSSGGFNYFKQLQKLVPDTAIDPLIIGFLKDLENTYPNITVDISEYDQKLTDVFDVTYKFFIRNTDKLMYRFLREYIMNNKTRKALTDPYAANLKSSTYPKDQYGTKEFYVLVSKLPKIINTISDDNIALSTFINHIKRGYDDLPGYIKRVSTYLDKGIIIDNGVVDDMFERFMDSAEYAPTINRLETDITDRLIDPYIEKNGLSNIKAPIVLDVEPEEDDEED